MGNVRFRGPFWEAFEGESWGNGGDTVSAGVLTVGGGDGGQAMGGVEPGILAGRDERKPGGGACERCNEGQ